MNAFANAVKNQEARTSNGMKARVSTSSALTDLFFKIGASRGKNIIPQFTAAYAEDEDRALRIVQWARDVREGAGERQLFKDIVLELEVTNPDYCRQLLNKIPELGRWDDLLLGYSTQAMKDHALNLIEYGLLIQNGLCAKWMPRKGPWAKSIRDHLGLRPKQYRKLLVEGTNVVESKMCAKQWDDINFSHVPSLASSRYKKAFGRNSPKYKEYLEKLVKGDKSVKVNAAAVYPYDILKGMLHKILGRSITREEMIHVNAQWKALPNYVGDANVLAVVDVSGSMATPAGGYSSKSMTTCLDVAVSLGLYVADKNKGAFKDTFLTFSTEPELLHLKGDICEKMKQMAVSKWEMSTNLHGAIKLILKTALMHHVPQEDMPQMLLIMSDMQFNQCAKYDNSAMEMLRRKYEEAGYQMPQIVFWNINAADNVPVSMSDSGVALVSGFSPSILKSVLAADLEQFTPLAIMDKTIMSDRYAL